MPTFRDQARSDAPPEEVWKLLYDPARFPEWWAGIGSVEGATGDSFTMYPEGYPDFPMAQVLETREDASGVKISCLVSDLAFEWGLRAREAGTEITVEVEIPEAEAARLDTQRDIVRRSLARLAELAESRS